jgi:monoamine oxidase
MLDVAIVGAGAAGLGAAKAASSYGLSFAVVEAASFIGGRARTDTSSLGVPYDLGCRTLYGGSDNPFVAYAKDIGAALGPRINRTAYYDGSRFLDANSTESMDVCFEKYLAALVSAHESTKDAHSSPDCSFADVVGINDCSAQYFRMSDHPSLAPAADVSIADTGCTSLMDTGDEVLDGYGSLILSAAAGIAVSTDCPVSAIDLSGKFVSLETPKGRIKAKAVIITVSTAVLAAERIALRPNGWPDWKVAAIDAVPTISMTKVGFRLGPGTLPPEFTTDQDNQVTGSCVMCAAEEPENIIWLLGVGGGELATAYFGGQFSRDLALSGEAAQIDWATQHLRKMLGNDIADAVVGSCATPFDREPWIDGGNSYCRLGTGNQRPTLAEPIDNKIYFAGEACSLNSPGVVHGAWDSGLVAIERILQCASALGQ